MTADPRRLSDIYDRALLCPREERAAFLAEACAGDDGMRRTLEAMLTEADEASAFFQKLAAGLGPLAADAGASLEGRRLGAYTVGPRLGAGGMGEVYRAHDDKLGRDVAIKILPDFWAADPDRRSRFDREARLLAALNHPHIAAIYGIEESEGIRALVLELVEGPTLAERIARAALPMDDALTIARQIAEALEAAHERGIVHRDLKPANIKTTPDGIVKVLDFGLAKAISGDGVSELHVSTSGQTREGAVVGTVSYMSPEQARGKPVDKRSDIWAFGCVLYEMLARRRAFAGQTASDTIVAILEGEPNWSALPEKTPAAVRRLLQRCFEKDPRQRLRDIGEARIELAEVLGTGSASPSGAAASADEEPRRRSWPWWVAAALVVALGAIATPLWYWRLHGGDASIVPGRPRQITVAPGWEGEPAISPDGSFIAYASNESGNGDIWIIDVRGGNTLRLTTGEGFHHHPAWFPDGSAMAFVSTRGQHDGIWKVARLGGAATLIVDDAMGPAISPDGAHIAFTRAGPAGFQRVAVAPVADPSHATFVTGDEDGLWDHVQPAWSPDSQTICYAAHKALWLVKIAGGRPWRLTTDNEYDREPAWSADGRYVYFSSSREGTEALWRVPATGGRPTRITLGTGPEREPSVSRDGSRLAYSTMSSNSDVALLNLHTGKEQRIADQRHETKPTIAPDMSAVVFASDRWAGRFDLWVQPLVNLALAGPPHRLTDHAGSATYPAFSPDGRWIAYGRVEGERRDIWIIPAAGGIPTRLTDGTAARFHPSWSPDGTRVAFVAADAGSYRLEVLPVTGGRASGSTVTAAVVPAGPVSPTWSPDGAELAYVCADDIWIVKADGTEAPRRIVSAAGAERVRWNRASKRLFASGFWGDDRVTVRVVDPKTGALAPLPFPAVLGHTYAFVDFDVSADERLLAFDCENLKGDIWLLESTPRS